MPDWTAINSKLKPSSAAYIYDGCFRGFLCCVFASYAQKEIPAAIYREKDKQDWIFDFFRVPTDWEKAARVTRSLTERLGARTLGFLRLAFYTCLPDKELRMLRFAQLGYEAGAAVWEMLADDRVRVLHKAVLRRSKEIEKYQGFLRFSLRRGVMIAAFSPQNFILSALGAHFSRRFCSEQLIIYDKTYHMAFVYSKGKCRLTRVEELIMPEPEQEELAYRQLWRLFFNAIAINERENPRCQLTHLPKRYRSDMTEFQSNEDAPERIKSRSGIYASLLTK